MNLEFKLRRRKNKLFIHYVLSKDEIELLAPLSIESPYKNIEHVTVYVFKDEQEAKKRAKKIMENKEIFIKMPFALQQTIPAEKFVETFQKAFKLAEKKSDEKCMKH
ncbi:MAG: hypothetical protein QXX41_05795 [Nitrososphaerota archaeon]